MCRSHYPSCEQEYKTAARVPHDVSAHLVSSSMKISIYRGLFSALCAIAIIWLIIRSGRNKKRLIVGDTSEILPVLIHRASENRTLKKFATCPAFDPRFKARDLFQSYFEVLQKPAWIERQTRYSISYDALHALLYGDSAKNIYSSWPNFHRKSFNESYRHTSLTVTAFESIAERLTVPLRFVVEVGSFIGKSATNIAHALQKNPEWADRTVVLCIDTWLGGLEHWTLMRYLSPLEYGRPMIYEQFLANIIAANLTNIILPLSMPSLIGAQWLLNEKLFPQIIYLDSAHLEGETLIELELYWVLLQPGGLLIGDDWKWDSVRCDVLRFIDSLGVKAVFIGNTWYIKKEKI